MVPVGRERAEERFEPQRALDVAERIATEGHEGPVDVDTAAAEHGGDDAGGLLAAIIGGDADGGGGGAAAAGGSSGQRAAVPA
ncbi:MAG: hypothetical protein R2755_28445 [Acidimicrobiales bacterium]